MRYQIAITKRTHATAVLTSLLQGGKLRISLVQIHLSLQFYELRNTIVSISTNLQVFLHLQEVPFLSLLLKQEQVVTSASCVSRLFEDVTRQVAWKEEEEEEEEVPVMFSSTCTIISMRRRRRRRRCLSCFCQHTL